jgi:alkanesulfonate monooxygenase SsuD/methylene tetrahydromethanopterin reductase-like flavin-dependent oxidoreductase (luciferase family)
MTACFLGETDTDVLDRVGGFLSIRGDATDSATLVADRRDRWLVGTVDEVGERIEELRELGVTRVFLQHLNHADDEMIGLASSLG